MEPLDPSTDSAAEAEYLTKTYKQMNQKEHILQVQDTYVGSIESSTRAMLVYDRESTKLVPRVVSVTPALHKIIDETLMNARDHAYRMTARLRQQGLDVNKEKLRRVNDVKLDVDADTGAITVFNDGDGLDVAMHPVHNVWIPEMVFTNPLASSNFDKDDDDIVAGKNGYGAKCTIIWSVWARLETVDLSRGLRYVQVFEDNLKIIHPPEITKLTKAEKSKGPFTSLQFCPDYIRLGFASASLSSDFVDLLHKRAIDVACTSPLTYSVGGKNSLRVWFNGTQIPQRSFKEYIRMVLPEGVPFEYERADDRWEYAVVLRKDVEELFRTAVCDVPETWRHVSFVNGVCTYLGGTSVDYITKQTVDPLVAIIEKKNKIKVTPDSIRKQMVVFLRCDVVKPAFTDQSKSSLTTKMGKGINACVISEAFIKRIAAMGGGHVIERAANDGAARQDRLASVAANGGTRRGGLITGIAMFTDATYARCPSQAERGKDIILNLVEGQSAQAGAMSGEMDMDYNGVLGMRGKITNVREKSKEAYQKDKSFITSLIRASGLKYGQVFADAADVRRNLRYTRWCILCDQDVDGSHIKGLVINCLSWLWPSLLRVPGFLWLWSTPIVIVRAPKCKAEYWYSLRDYQRWAEENPNLAEYGKYYKGLGTSTKDEWLDYVAHPKQSAVVFGDESEACLDVVFGPKSEKRRKWIEDKLPDVCTLDINAPQIKVEDFLNNEMILFSMADNIRSIPSVMDGLKPSQRKALFGCFRRNLVQEIKVSTLAGYVTEHTQYHAGETSLQSTVIRMSQNFVGSNNVNLLVPAGQFGTRLLGGQDAAAARYLFTRLTPIARMLFPRRDDAVIPQLVEDGMSIEPAFYLPIICMLLVNGSSGIGTGWKSEVAPRDPLQILQYHRLLLLGKTEEAHAMELPPFYEGHVGEVRLVAGKTDEYISRGIWERTSPTEVLVSELPIGKWIIPIKDLYDTMVGEDHPIMPVTGKRKRAETDVGSVVSNETNVTATGKRKRSAVDAKNVPKGEADAKTKKEVPKLLQNCTSSGTDSFPRFLLSFHSETQLNDLLTDESRFEKTFQLATNINDTLTAFRADGSIYVYKSVHEMLDDFHGPRLELYSKRKAHMLQEFKVDAFVAENRVRFIKAVRSGELVLSKLAGATEARALLSEDGYYRKEDDSAEYEYLLSMRIDAQTEKRIAGLEKEHRLKIQAIEDLNSKTPEMLWLEDLDALEPMLLENRAARRAMTDPASANERKKSKEPTDQKTKRARSKKSK